MLREWAVTWGIPFAAIADLEQRVGMFGSELTSEGTDEAHVQSEIRLEAARLGVLLFRNNVGALPDKTGRIVRYGLCNDSEQVNKRVKSGDLVGVEPILITAAHVGTTIGRFISVECKEPGWRYSGNDREPAQLAWVNLINAKGGRALFASGPGVFK